MCSVCLEVEQNTQSEKGQIQDSSWKHHPVWMCPSSMIFFKNKGDGRGHLRLSRWWAGLFSSLVCMHTWGQCCPVHMLLSAPRSAGFTLCRAEQERVYSFYFVEGSLVQVGQLDIRVTNLSDFKGKKSGTIWM